MIENTDVLGYHDIELTFLKEGDGDKKFVFSDEVDALIEEHGLFIEYVGNNPKSILLSGYYYKHYANEPILVLLKKKSYLLIN